LTAPRNDWLLWLCASRTALSLIFCAYAGVLPFVREAWGMSAAQAATVQSAWQLGYLVSLFAVGLLADRYGARRTYLVGSVLAAASALLFALAATDYPSAVLLYGLAGLCSGGSYTPGLALIHRHSPPHLRGRAMGWFVGASSLGYALALVGIAVLGALWSWRAGLVFAGLAAGVGACCGWRALRELVDEVRPATAPAAGGLTPLADTLRDRRAMACNWAYTFHCWELFALWAWLPSFLAAAAGSGGALGASLGIGMAALAHLVGVAGSVGGGIAGDRLGRVRAMLVISCASLACSFLFGWLWALPFWLLVLAAGLYNLLAVADSSVYSSALAEAVPPHRLGAGYSVRSVMGFGAGAASPVVFGLALDAGVAGFGADSALSWVAAWSSVGLGALLGPAMILRFQALQRTAERSPMLSESGEA